MTAQEIIEKIRAEIERLMKENSSSSGLEGGVLGLTYEDGINTALNNVLAKLDTLQEQPVCEGLEEEINRTYHDGSVTDTSDLDHNSYENIARHFAKWQAEHRGSSETPKDLEEAAVEYSAIGYSPFDDPYEKNQQFECSKFAFIDGAKWQKEKMTKEAEKPCHTVEEWMEHIKNADQLTKDIFSKGPYNVLYDALNHPYRDCYDAIKEFGELCYQTARQDMMKEAVEGRITQDSDTKLIVVSEPIEGFKFGDKVKLIIVKED